MKKDNGRICNLVSIPTAGVLLLFFFLPWVKVTCGGHTLADASGLQVSTGKMSPSSELDQLTSQFETSGAKVEKKSESGETDPKPMFWAGLGIPLLILLSGGLGAAGKLARGAGGGMLTVLGIAGLALMVLAMQLDYTEEAMKQTKKDKPAAPAPSGAPEMNIPEPEIETEPTEIVYLAILLYILVAGLGVGVAKSRPPEPAGA